MARLEGAYFGTGDALFLELGDSYTGFVTL